MTLFSGLKVSTSGLQAQGTKMGAISDNIANVNTVGYKRTDVQFSTLVTERIRETKFVPGGVLARPRQQVDLQGQLIGSSASTDLAVSGKGFFIVTEKSGSVSRTDTAATATGTTSAVSGSGGISSDELRYTRAGSFRADASGFLKNSAGFYLQGWAVNREGQVTQDGSIQSVVENSPTEFNLESVNVNRIATVAEATTNLRLRANLPAEAGAQALVGMYPAFVMTTINRVISDGVAPLNALTSTRATAAVSAARLVLERGGTIAQAATAAETAAVNAGASAAEGQEIEDRINGTSAVAASNAQAYSAADVEAVIRAIAVRGPTTQIVDPGAVGVNITGDGTLSTTSQYQIAVRTAVNLMMRDNPSAVAAISTAVQNALTAAGVTAANAALVGAAITGTAVVVDDLDVAATDSVRYGSNLAAVSTTPAKEMLDLALPSGNAQFSSTTTVFDAEGVEHSVRYDWYKIQSDSNGSTFGSSADLLSANTWAVRLASDAVTGLRSGLNGFDASDNAASTGNNEATATTSTLDSTSYTGKITDASAVETPRFAVWTGSKGTPNTTTGAPSAEQNRAVVTTDTLFFRFNGDGSLEGVYTQPTLDDASRVLSRATNANDPVKMIQVAVGAVEADPDGTTSTSATNTNLVRAIPAKRLDGTVVATGGTSPFGAQGAQSLVFDWDIGRPTNVAIAAGGTPSTPFSGTGLDGISQFASGEATPTLETFFVGQDGLRAGVVSGVTVDEEGLMTAIYDNGATRKIYKIPLASFTDPNGLINATGNIYQESRDSGAKVIQEAQQGVNGSIAGSALEQANVDLGTEFTDMIVTQQAFTANTRAITTTDEMLTDINNMVR